MDAAGDAGAEPSGAVFVHEVVSERLAGAAEFEVVFGLALGALIFVGSMRSDGEGLAGWL